MAVDRCICHNVTFAELKKLADGGVRDLDELSNRTGCGTGCGMCIPYIRVMLATGIPDLPVLSTQQADSIVASHPAQGT